MSTRNDYRDELILRNAELARLREVNAKLVEALKAAQLTYVALARNNKQLIEALGAKGWPSSWLSQEFEKAGKVEAALALAEEKHAL